MWNWDGFKTPKVKKPSQRGGVKAALPPRARATLLLKLVSVKFPALELSFMSKTILKPSQRPLALLMGRYLFACPSPSCICDWMVRETGKPYKCEPETFENCVARRRREASASAPSAKPPLSNRGVSSSLLAPSETVSNVRDGEE